ncbi:MAG TPA: class I SAM-dependent methyltransferase [Candidatus Angelobacter sp.]|nr:class I SAM-dependent methyltransferase [Candidatus Angelobacter sp.]
MIPVGEPVHQRESDFHDQWASATDIRCIDVRAAFESPAALENRFILRLLGPLSGKKIVDIGAGLGESSVYFALHGATVTCTDLSAGMVSTAQRLAEFHGVRIEGVVSPAEHLQLPSNSFDVAYVANTIHHVSDKPALLQEIRRVLKPGGIFVSMDPLTYNPVIGVYRRMATEVRTQDESPLSFRDLGLVKRYFVDVHHREFWILSLALFLKYYAIDRIHPNQDRYWKRIYKETESSLVWWKPLRWLDSGLTRIPLVRRLGWNMVMWGRKAVP